MTKAIGILGGMGPEATLDCFGKIIKNTPAKTDREHLRVVMDSNPRIPDRIAAILGRGESPVPALVAGCQGLEKAGADFIIIPCVTVHFFLPEIQAQSPLPILSIFDAVAEAVHRHLPGAGTVGLMGTSATIRAGFFQKRLAGDKIHTIVPDSAQQSKIVAAIKDIKDTGPSRTRAEITSDLIEAARSLIDREPHGADAIIAGCTEIPLVLGQEHLPVPYFDSLTILARAAIRFAGKIPIDYSAK
ncbi:MAG: amino acid racemase [Desulfobacteraceae bacterium]|jgi:aspartate racemase|nr:amino acid racemase [Desulfobacteraceae bacterium]